MRRQLLISMAAFLLSASLPALAQNAPSFGAPPARIANIYGWKDHQPTQQDVDDARAAAGLPRSSLNRGQTVNQVETEVQALLKQTDALDRRSAEDSRGYSGAGMRASR
ncbi:MAG TPA: hypothetical protein VMA53_17635 [Stellaceae bacterium]|nr:hypothetical protein [Stellaceae bacterium]